MSTITLRQKCLAEATGTFCLVFAGTGAIIINSITGSITHVGESITFGLVILAMIFAVGDVSGAHLNPAVTLGFVLARRLPPRAAPPYILSQIVGAILASLLLRFLFPAHPTLGTTMPRLGAMQGFVLEIVLTTILMLVILSIATGPKERGTLAALAVGSVIGLEAMFAGPITGASMNPARSLAPALVAMRFESLWVYLLAPPIGAAIAVPLARAIYGPTSTQEGSSNE